MSKKKKKQVKQQAPPHSGAKSTRAKKGHEEPSGERADAPYPVWAEWAICLLLAIVTFAVYVQVRDFDFVNYDDTTLYMTQNPRVPSGLSLSNVKWAFTTGHASNWHPLAWLSHMLDVELFGMKAGPHHVVNVLLHVANTLLLFLILRRMAASWNRSAALPASAFVAAVFALHPLHVESVAWVSERKDVLSTFFWLLVMGAYLRYTRRPGIGRYVLVALFLALGLMAKPMLVTLPAALLLLDFWPLGRLTEKVEGEVRVVWGRVPRLVVEKVPLFGLAVGSSVITFLVQQAGKSVAAFDVLPVSQRVGNAVLSYGRYVLMTLWPAKLAVFYPHPGPDLAAWQVAVSLLVLVGITGLVLWQWRARPYLVVGWFWYAGTLLPVIGLIQVGAQALADRYMYVPLTGLGIMAAWGAADLAKALRIPKAGLAGGAVAVLAAFTVCTGIQASYWENSLTLFSRALAVTEKNHLAHKNYGVALANEERHREAIGHYVKAINIRSNDADLYYNLGNALDELGEAEKAIREYRKALEKNPEHTEAHYNLGNTLAKEGKFGEAAEEYRKVLELDPGHMGATINMGNALAIDGKAEEAAEIYGKVIEMDPENLDALINLGNALAQLGKAEEAVTYYERARDLKPDHIDTHCNLGYALIKLGKLKEAEKAFAEAVRLNPGHTTARQNLENLRKELARRAEEEQ